MRCFNCLNAGGFGRPILALLGGLCLLVIGLVLLARARVINPHISMTPVLSWGDWTVSG